MRESLEYINTKHGRVYLRDLSAELVYEWVKVNRISRKQFIYWFNHSKLRVQTHFLDYTKEDL